MSTLKKKENKKFYKTENFDDLNFTIINLKQNCFIFGN